MNTKELIKKGISIIEDNDEFATIDWKYQELKKIIIKLSENSK